jgi:hypothetical protein
MTLPPPRPALVRFACALRFVCPLSEPIVESVCASACTEAFDPHFLDLAALWNLDFVAAFAAVIRIGIVGVKRPLAAQLIVCHTFVATVWVMMVKDCLDLFSGWASARPGLISPGVRCNS